MEIPYCIVDGKEYQLEFDKNGTLRFPNTKEPCEDLNDLHIDYINGKIDLQVIWEEYTQTGSSFGLVEGYFSKYGMNNHTVANGNGKFKKFELFSGDEETDNYYKDSNVGVELKLDKLNQHYNFFTKEERIELLEEILKELKSE